MNLLSLPSKYPLGIDIADLSLKLIQLKKVRHSITVQTLSKVIVPEGYINVGVIKNQTGVVDLLKKLTEETIFGKTTSREVIACLPETKTFTKLITISSSEKNLSEAVNTEIEKNVPFELSDINYDWQLIKKDSESQKILIGVVPKNIADDYYNLLTKADLLPIVLEIEPMAIARSILPPTYDAEGTTLIIDIGATRSGLIAYADNTILFTISLPVSGKKYTEIIAKKLNLSLSKAEAGKVICGLDPKLAHGTVVKILAEMTEELVSKIKEAIKYLHANYPEYTSIGKIWLCGGGANMKGLAEILTKKLKINTAVSNVFVNINISQRKKNKYFHEELIASKKSSAKQYKRKQNFSLAFATAVGLALRGIHVDEV